MNNYNDNNNQIPNDKLINFANNIDNLSLNNNQDYNSSKINYPPQSPSQQNLHNPEIIKSLTNEIMNNLKENNNEFIKKETYENELNLDDDDDEIYEINNKKNKKNNKNENSSMFQNFSIKNFIILFAVYFILSQDMVKDAFSMYLTCLNPDEYGRIGMMGVVLYGLILTILYFFIINLF